MSITILIGDVHARLAELPDDYFDCVLSSPPYWGLRSYLDAEHTNKHLEIGCEPTLGEHIEVLVRVMDQVRRVLKPSGVCWINYGDCYATSPNGRSAADTKAAGGDDRTFRDKPFSTVGPIYVSDYEKTPRAGKTQNNNHTAAAHGGRVMAGGYLKPKDLCLVPFRLAIALQEAGWWVRSVLPWVKRNGMPESITDRPASSIEYVLMLTKSERYAYDADAVRRPASASTNARVAQNVAAQKGSERANGGAKTNGSMKAVVRGQTKQDATAAAGGSSGRRMSGFNDRWDAQGGIRRPKRAAANSGIRANDSYENATCHQVLNDRNFRNSDLFFDSLEPPYSLISAAGGTPLAIDVCPQGFKEAHFATFPERLAEPLLRAGNPARGPVLDMFGGAGTVGLVGDRLGMDVTLIELNPESAEISRRRINGDGGMFSDVRVHTPVLWRKRWKPLPAVMPPNSEGQTVTASDGG